MRALIQAIKVFFDAEVTFKAALTGGLHLSWVPNDQSPPYCFFTVREDPFWAFDTNYEHYVLNFFLVSDATSADEITSLYDKLKDCFDEAALTVTGYHAIRFWRKPSNDIQYVDTRWMLGVEYECNLEES